MPIGNNISSSSTGDGATELNLSSSTLQGISTYNQNTQTFTAFWEVKPGLNANLIADGSVSNTQFQYLSGATSNLQTQINSIISGTSFRGGYDASSNLFPSTGGSGLAGAIKSGDNWAIAVGGILGGKPVIVGTTITALIDTPLQNANNWSVPEDKVLSVFGRIGAITSQSGDYNIGQITDGLSSSLASGKILVGNASNIATTVLPSGDVSMTNLGVFTLLNSAVIGKVLTGLTPANGTVVATDNILQAMNKLTHYASNSVSSFNARTGAITSQSGDYNIGQITDGLSSSLASARIYIGNVSNVATPLQLTGEATLLNTGAITLNNASVISKLLTGLTITNSAIVAADSLLVGLGKAQGQINAVISSSVTSVFGRTGPAIIAQVGDYSVAQVTGAAPSASPAFTGIPTAPTAIQGVNSTQLATTAYVDTGLATKEPTITVLPITKGGTGQTTATTARNALLPSQTGNAGRVLSTNGANVSWIDPNTGSVTTVSVVSDNGFGGTVVTSSTTPAITISTSVTGLLKGDGTALIPAVATDVPITNDLTLVKTALKSSVNSEPSQTVQVYPSPESPTSSITFTTLSEPILLVAPAVNAMGRYMFRLVSSTGELNVTLEVSGNIRTSYRESLVSVREVRDSAGIITATNISQFLLFRGYSRNITPNSYFVITVSTPYALLYTNPISMTVYQYTGGSYLNENFTITNMITTDISNLVNLAPPDLVFNVFTTFVPVSTYTPQGYLYASANTGGTISQFSINNLNGALAALAPATVTTPAVPYAVATTGLRNFLYATNQTTNAIYQYSINSTTGALTALSPISVAGAAAPTGIAIDPTDRYVYTCGFNAPGTIGQFTITKATGQLVAIAGALNAVAGMQDIAVHPSGKFVYAINTATNNIFQYSINSTTGALTALSPLNVATGTSPFNIAIHPNGLYAYVLNNATATISQYSINTTTGQLTALSPATFASGGNPFGLCISRNGRFIYHASATAGNVSQSTINLTTGLIGTPTTTIAVPTARHCAIDFSGNFLYSSNTSANQTRAFSINQTTGALTAVAPNLTLGANITSLATI